MCALFCHSLISPCWNSQLQSAGRPVAKWPNFVDGTLINSQTKQYSMRPKKRAFFRNLLGSRVACLLRLCILIILTMTCRSAKCSNNCLLYSPYLLVLFSSAWFIMKRVCFIRLHVSIHRRSCLARFEYRRVVGLVAGNVLEDLLSCVGSFDRGNYFFYSPFLIDNRRMPLYYCVFYAISVHLWLIMF